MRKHNRFALGTGCYTCQSCGRRTRETSITAGHDGRICSDCFELASYQNGISDNGLGLYDGQFLSASRSHARAIFAKGGTFNWREAFWAECGAKAQDEIHALALALRRP